MGLGLGLYDCQITLSVGLRKGCGTGLNTVRISGRQLPFKWISLLFTEVRPRRMLTSGSLSHKKQAKDGKLPRQQLRRETSDSLPLELVGKEGWLIFTCSLKRWRRLRRTDRILNMWGKGEK